ncbi:MAG: hypothetical protein QXL24_07600, partial [Candidatus Jordarchaeaceae archaeon]
MIEFQVPGMGKVEIKNVVFDLNGTLSMNGTISQDVEKKIRQLSQRVNVFIMSSDTRGNLKELAEKL